MASWVSHRNASDAAGVVKSAHIAITKLKEINWKGDQN
jgi:hypothetical protein